MIDSIVALDERERAASRPPTNNRSAASHIASDVCSSLTFRMVLEGMSTDSVLHGLLKYAVQQSSTDFQFDTCTLVLFSGDGKECISFQTTQHIIFCFSLSTVYLNPFISDKKSEIVKDNVSLTLTQ